MAVSLYVIKAHMYFHKTFCLDFLGLFIIYFEDFFANTLTKWV